VPTRGRAKMGRVPLALRGDAQFGDLAPRDHRLGSKRLDSLTLATRNGKDCQGLSVPPVDPFHVMIRRGQCMSKEPGAKGEVRFVNNLFGIAA
jgi:hypothetical protein